MDTALYRITQEALTNARKHGAARRALIDIQAADDGMRITICDDGTGFDTDAKTHGFGLQSMRERAELLGGMLLIDSAPGRHPDHRQPTVRV